MEREPMPQQSTGKSWFRDPERSLDMVRIVVALVILIHPLHALTHPGEISGYAQLIAHPFHAFTHPGDISDYGHVLQSQGPLRVLSLGLAWAAILLQVGCSLALLVRRLVIPACVGHILVLAAGIWLLHAPHWYALGGAAEDGHPGAEVSVLLIACLMGVLWAQWRGAARRGLDVVRVAAALVLIAHPLHGVMDPAGLRDFGHGLESKGFPFGLALVWMTMCTQIGCSLALLARRLVVPACLGHIFVLSMGIWISHAPRWFVVGPGENGMEYSVVLITCFLSVLLAHWPRLGEEALAGEPKGLLGRLILG